MTAGAGPEPVTTGSRRLVPGEAGAGGYRTLVAADGERHLVRDDLAGMSLPAGWRRSARPLLVIAHLSDTHVMDHQSPGRAELFDRYSDPDSPVRAEVGVIGTYRAQELFTYQVAEAMVRAVRHAKTAPLSGAPVDPAVLAVLARELAANDWQVRDQISAEGGAGAGIEADRNVLLAIDWPRPVSRTGLFVAPEHPVPPPAGQQHLPRELSRGSLVPAVEAPAFGEQAVTGTVACAVPAVPGPPDLSHVLHDRPH